MPQRYSLPMSKKTRAKLDLLEEKCIDDNWSVEMDTVRKLERFYKIHLEEMSASNSRVHTDVDTTITAGRGITGTHERIPM